LGHEFSPLEEKAAMLGPNMWFQIATSCFIAGVVLCCNHSWKCWRWRAPHT
jgi:hypothetical protein